MFPWVVRRIINTSTATRWNGFFVGIGLRGSWTALPRPFLDAQLMQARQNHLISSHSAPPVLSMKSLVNLSEKCPLKTLEWASFSNVWCRSLRTTIHHRLWSMGLLWCSTPSIIELLTLQENYLSRLEVKGKMYIRSFVCSERERERRWR